MPVNKVEILKYSVGPNGKPICTFLIEHPHIIHPEILRHRLFSFSVASSRAMPYRVVKNQIIHEPFMPLGWQKEHKGMQGTEYHNAEDSAWFDGAWTRIKDMMVEQVNGLDERGLTKQLLNRLLEPWAQTRMVLTATEFDNFFNLRIHDDAEIHIRETAQMMKDAMDNATPEVLEEGQWHMPFIDDEAIDFALEQDQPIDHNLPGERYFNTLVNISAARCARTSYGKNIGKSIEKELDLASTLASSGHMSPYEHQAKAVNAIIKDGKAQLHHKRPQSLIEATPPGMEFRVVAQEQHKIYEFSPICEWEYWSRNLKGWVQARALVERSLKESK